jgi:hypothetical protein
MFTAQGILRWLIAFHCIFASVCPARIAFAQDAPAAAQMSVATPSEDALPDAPEPQIPISERGLPLAILKDQISIWTSPVRVRTHDLIWLLPLGAATGVALVTDTHVMRNVSHRPAFNKDSVNASNILLGSQIAIPVGLYGVGLLKGDPHARETGVLSAEALVDSVVVEEVVKIIFRRERPLHNDAAGNFFAPNVGANGSFPSSHSMLAWTLAGVVTGEYSSKWIQVTMYSIASGVSLTRVLGQEHFPSDVLVGGATGWLIGHYVFSKHRVHHRSHSALKINTN